MSTCQRCGRCFEEPSALEELKMKGYRLAIWRTTGGFSVRASYLEGEPAVEDIPIEMDLSCHVEEPLPENVWPILWWVYHANSGGCNGCDIEVLNVLTPYYDVERFGIKTGWLAASRGRDALPGPRDAFHGPTPHKRAYDAMPAPSSVFAIGSCACGGWHLVRQLSVLRTGGRESCP